MLFLSTRMSLSTPVLALKSAARIKKKIFLKLLTTSLSRFENVSGSKYNESFEGCSGNNYVLPHMKKSFIYPTADVIGRFLDNCYLWS